MRTHTAVGVAALVATLAAPAPFATSAPEPGAVVDAAAVVATVERARPAVHEVRVIGRSVRGRRILAYRVGEPQARRTAVVTSTMHGDERDTVDIVRHLRDGPPVHGIDLWLVPLYNRDGYARGTRANARGVDLNRNFPVRWAPLPPPTDSGPAPASEPETRAFMRFLRSVRPHYLVSFHQPLHAVDTSQPRVRPFARRLARELRLPTRALRCDGGCHGTMTQWFNATFPRRFAVTVELSASPRPAYLGGRAVRGTLRALGGRRRG